MDHSRRINVRKTAFLMAKVPHLGVGPARFFPDQSHFTSSPRLAAEGFFPTATPPHIQSTSSHQYQNYHQYQHHPLLSRDDNLPHSSLRRGLEARKSPKGQGGTKGSPQHCRATTMSHSCRPWYTRQHFSIIYCFLHISQVNPFLGRGTRGQIANIRWITENAREFQKNIYFCFIDCAKAFDCGSQGTVENSSRDGNTRPLDLPREICTQVKEEQLKPGMEQQTGSKLGKEYVKAVYYHPAYLTYMQSRNARQDEAQAGIKIEISITSDIQMTSPLWQKVKKN